MDPSGLPEYQIVVENKTEQRETITGMDCDSYNAAAEGKIEVFEDINYQHSLNALLTPNKNTVLHIYITSLDTTPKSTIPIGGSESTTTLKARSNSRTNFVEEILAKCPVLLQQANVKGETLLHIAARYGHDDIVEFLIKYCAQTVHQDLEGGIDLVKKMLRMTNKEKDTALHEAVRSNHLEVVKLLINEDPNFSYLANDFDETPLYIAAERGFEAVVEEILNKCKSPITYGGPGGRTALHAAVIKSAAGITRRILDKIEGISRMVDNDGWTSLHLIAYVGDYSGVANVLMEKDRDVAYMKDTRGRTALHIAAQRGFDRVVLPIVLRCPDCCELVDNRGWNVLHFAFDGDLRYWHESTIKIILENLSHSNLLNEKNADGDTPIHFYSSSFRSAKKFSGHPRVDSMAFNKKNLCALDIAIPNIDINPKRKAYEIMKRLSIPVPRRVLGNEDGNIRLEEWRKRNEKEIEMKKKRDKEMRTSKLQV